MRCCCNHHKGEEEKQVFMVLLGSVQMSAFSVASVVCVVYLSLLIVLREDATV